MQISLLLGHAIGGGRKAIVVDREALVFLCRERVSPSHNTVIVLTENRVARGFAIARL